MSASGNCPSGCLVPVCLPGGMPSHLIVLTSGCLSGCLLLSGCLRACLPACLFTTCSLDTPTAPNHDFHAISERTCQRRVSRRFSVGGTYLLGASPNDRPVEERPAVPGAKESWSRQKEF